MNQPAKTPGGALPPDLSSRWYNASDYAPGDPWRDFDPARTALVLVDLINWQTDPDGPSIGSIRAAGHGDRADYLLRRCAELIFPNLRALLPAARRAGVRVVHARLASRHPDCADIVPALRPYVRAARASDGSPAAAPIAEVGDEPGDLSVVKSGSGAFGGTELDFLLRREGIDTILYAGVVTTACVLLSVAGGIRPRLSSISAVRLHRRALRSRPGGRRTADRHLSCGGGLDRRRARRAGGLLPCPMIS